MTRDLDTLRKLHTGLKDRLAAVSPGERLRRLEIFLPDYVDEVQNVKKKFTPKPLPQELNNEVESIGKTVLFEVKFYFSEINKNHTVQMGDVLRQLNVMLNGLSLSESFRKELDLQSQSNNWHGH